MASSSRSQLGDSWVVHDSDDGDESWNEGTAPPPARATKSSKAGKASPGRKSQLRSSETSSAGTEPQLVMPTIEENDRTGGWTSSRNRPEQRQTEQRYKAKKTSTPGRASRASTRQRSATPDPASSSSAPAERTLNILGHSLIFILDILGVALKTIKYPLGLGLGIFFFLGLLTVSYNLLTSSIYRALSPICRIPGVSILDLPLCKSPYSSHSKQPAIAGRAEEAPVEFDQLMTVQSKFETILSDSASGVSLPLDMKRSETSIRDLRQVVRFSTLSSKNELVLEFDNFIETARIASYDLQKFNSHVGRGVDIVLSTARWTQRVLDDMAHKQTNRGLIPSFIHSTLLAPFQPVQFTESKLLDQYIQHTRIVSDEIEVLITEAQALLLVLQNLEDRLDVIHSISLRDDIAAQGSKDEVLGQLWTLLGGNRAALGKYNNQLKLLRQVGDYRKVAWAHVSGTILKLQAMGAELEELRTRVGSAEVLRDHKEIPLSVHVESIRLGVERLEIGRERARELERSHVRRVIDGGGEGAEGRMLVDG